MKRIMLFASVLAACVSSDQIRRNQYDADYQRALRQCGQPDAAFQSGYNEGYAGNRMRADWTVMCTPEVRAQTAASYQDGFLRGANDAPIRVVHTVKPIRVTGPRSTTTTTSVAECTFDSDCGDGYHCRDKTCMGQGYTGERCVFNDDCLSDHCFGGTCRE
jgi:hypothetical protein